MNVFWPISGAVIAVAGARIASTSLNSFKASARSQRRNFCALSTSAAGAMAPAMSRSRVAGSKSSARVRSLCRCRLAPSGAGMGDAAGSAGSACGDGDAQTIRAPSETRRHGLDRPIYAGRVVGIEALHGVIRHSEITRRTRERPEMIEAGDKGECARAAEAAVGRLQAERAAERRRGPDRAGGVGPE